MTPYPAICNSCLESATCVNVKAQQVYKVCCADPRGRCKPCNDVKVCPVKGILIDSVIKVE